MAYNQSCIYIQNCIGIGTDAPLNRLSINSDATILPAVGALASTNAGVVIAGIDGGLELFSQDDNTTWGHYLTMKRFNGSTGNLIAGFGFGTFTNTGNQGSNTFDALGIAYGTNVYPQDNTQLLTIKASGNVGIGTSSPSQRLHVVGRAIISNGTGTNESLSVGTTSSSTGTNFGTIDVNGTDYSAYYLRTSDTIRFSIFQTGGVTAVNTITSIPLTFGTADTERMRITNTGNVGIGTASPDQRLSVKSATASTYNPTAYSGANAPMLLISSTCGTSDFSGIRFTNSNGSVEGLIAYVQSVGGAVNCADFVFQGFGNNSSYSEKMRITGAGNVGIGATSPAAKLHLCGSGDNIFRGESTNTGTVASYYITNVGATAKRYYAGVNVAAADGGYAISDSTCSDAVRFYIKSEGSIGVATISPTYKLHVNGTFYAAGSSIKYKEGICNYDTNSCLFMCLKPVTYQYKDEFKHLGKELKSETQIGLIAEDVADVMPELAVLVNEEDEKVVRNVDYEKLSIVLLTEVQKLRKEVDQLKAV